MPTRGAASPIISKPKHNEVCNQNKVLEPAWAEEASTLQCGPAGDVQSMNRGRKVSLWGK